MRYDKTRKLNNKQVLNIDLLLYVWKQMQTNSQQKEVRMKQHLKPNDFASNL